METVFTVSIVVTHTEDCDEDIVEALSSALQNITAREALGDAMFAALGECVADVFFDTLKLRREYD